MTTTLGEIPIITDNIKNAPIKTIKLFYKLLFGSEGDRQSRKKVCEFTGFPFEFESSEYEDKVEFIDKNFSVNDLSVISNILRVDYEADKRDLIETICEQLVNLQCFKEQVEKEDKEEEKEEDKEDEEKFRVNKDDEYDTFSNAASYRVPTFSMNFRDIEGTIRSFDGTNEYPVEKWISELEDISIMWKWTELHKFVFAKKSISGLAKLFIESEPNINSYRKLKKALLQEFSSQLTHAKVHEMLIKRKINRNETVQEYYLKMRELANRGSVDDISLMQYVIDGITDDLRNKAVLFGAKSLKEFKEKLKIYNEIRSKMETKPTTERPSMEHTGAKPKTNSFSKSTRCYNCGGSGHVSRDCVHRDKGAKCFKCQKFGHKARDCNSRGNHEEHVNIVEQETLKGTCLKVCFEKYTLQALLDTGSSVNLIQATEFLKVSTSPIERRSIKLVGLGKAETLGQTRVTFKINDVVCNINIHVVPDTVIPMPMILGKEFYTQYDIHILAGEIVSIEKIQEEEKTDDSKPNYYMQVDVYDENDEISVGNHDYREEVMRLIDEYVPAKCPKTTGITMKIILTDEIPVYQRARRLPIPESAEVDKVIAEWTQRKIIRPSTSDYASPVVPVKKKNGETRVCVDYRLLNRKTIKDRYPLPIIEDQLDKLRDARIFTTLDLKNGFHHVTVHEESIKYTAFITSKGQYEFVKMPFGLCNAPAVFQRFVNCVFDDLINSNEVLTYLDDLIIPANSYKEAISKLTKVLQRAQCYGLEINWKKCHFLTSEIEYLGYRITNNEIKPSATKIRAVEHYPKLTSAKDVQSFLGLTGVFRKFIPDYSIIARPLSELLKRDRKFEFGIEQQNAVEQLKTKLTQEPVLKIYSPELYTELHTDACQNGYGAVLMQRDPEDRKMHPVHYMSRKTNEAEQKYHSYELEVLAIIKALEKFRVYLLGIPFKIITDCAAFQMTLSKKEISPKIWRWASYIQQFNYTIEHRTGTKMKHCDALSRYPVMIARNEFLEKIKLAQDGDQHLQAIKEVLKQRDNYNNYILQHDLIYKINEDVKLLAVPQRMQSEIIKNTHENNGHFGVRKTEELIRREFWIPQLKQKIAKIIQNCVPCILAERKSGKQEGWLNNISKEELPLQTYHVDHLGPLPATSKGYKYLFVVVDAFTKFIWIYPTKTMSADEVLSKLELQKTVFGNPTRIIADRGGAFISKSFEDYCATEKIQLCHITAGVPRGNGQVERIHRIIIPSLTKLCHDNENNWYKFVPKLQSIINSTIQRSTNHSPSQLLFGVTIKKPEDHQIQNIIQEEFANLFNEQREITRQEAKSQILKVQEENRRNFNKNRREPRKYNVNDLVAIKRTQFITLGKLRGKYLGPYKIVKVKRNDRYDVEKVGVGEGPNKTSTAVDFMKPWPGQHDESSSDDGNDHFEDEIRVSDGRAVGSKDGAGVCAGEL